MVQERYKNLFVAGFYFFFTLLVLSKFLITDGIPHHGDFSFPVFTENWMKELYPLWNESTSASNFQNVNRAIFLAPFIFVFDFFSLKMDLLIKFLVFSLFFSSFFLSHLSIRFLVIKNLNKTVSKYYLWLAVFLGSVIFTLNPWVLDRVYAIFFWVAYIVTPPLLVLTYKLLRRITFYRIFAFALLFSYAALTPHYLLFTFAIIVVYVIVEVLFSKNRIFLFLNVLKSFFLILIIFCILNVYWIIPTIQVLLQSGVDPGYPLMLDNITVFSRNSNLINVIRGTDAWVSWLDWYGSQKKATDIGWFFWQIASLVGLLTYILFIKASIVKARAKTFFSIIFIVAVFMAQGFSSFIKSFYYWLIFDSPFNSLGWIFRDPNKFTGYVWIVYAFTATFILLSIVQQKQKYFRIKLVAFFIAFALAIFPKVDGYLYNYLLPVELPNSYYKAYNFLESNQDPKYKTIFIAPYEQSDGSNLSYGISHTWNKSRIATNSIMRSSPVSSFGFYHYTNPFAQMYDYIYPNNDLESVGLSLGTLGVQYLLYHADVTNAHNQVEKDLANFNSDKNLDLVFHDDFIYIYKVKSPVVAKITFYNKYGVVNGGLSAKNIIDEKLHNLPVLFQQQNLDNVLHRKEVENGAEFKISYGGKYLDSNILQMSDEIIWPAEYYSKNKQSDWTYVQTHNKYQTNRSWHSYVENFLKIHNKREFDFEKGAIVTYKQGAEYHLENSSKLTGQKNVYIRLLKSRQGGQVELDFGNSKKIIDTFSVNDYLETIYIGRFDFADLNKIVLKNVKGHNVINYLSFLSDENNDKISYEKNVFIADTNYPLYIDGKENYISNIFASIFINRKRDLSLSLNEGVISVEGRVIDNGIVEMKKGENIVKKYKPIESIDLIPGRVKYFNTDGSDFIDPIFREDQNSTWKRLESEVIENKDRKIFFFFDIRYWEIEQLHVRIDFLDSDKRYIGYNILNRGHNGEGVLSIREALMPPENSRYFKVSYMSLDSIENARIEVKTAYAELFEEMNPIQQIIALDKFLSLNLEPVELHYNKENAAEYTIETNYKGTGVVQFIESYDELWRMKLKNGKILKPIQINSIFNGFIIKEGWSVDGATIYYLPQKYYGTLLYVSFLAVFLLGGYSIYKFLISRSKN